MEEEPVKSMEEPVKSLYGTTPEHCEKMIDRSLASNKKVQFLRDAMEKAGCPLGRKFFKSIVCDKAAAGGFLEGQGIVVCSNAVILQDEVDQTLTHELIHAYDSCRAANLEWFDCAHMACSEIRAGNLSGDCHYRREVLRGHYDICKRHQECIRRRTTLSLLNNPGCISQKHIESSIDRVWNTCYKDTKPFDKVP